MKNSQTTRYFKLDGLGGHDPKMCFIDSPYPKELNSQDYKLSDGESVKDIYPAKAEVYMDNERKGKILGDFIGNTSSVLVVHRRVKDVIEAHCGTGTVEYLPFVLYNHKKQVCSTEYFIVNPLGTKDFLNIEESGVDYFETGEVISVGDLVLDPSKMKDAPHLFRVKEQAGEYIFSATLLRSLQQLDPPVSNFILHELKLVTSSSDSTEETVKLSSALISAATNKLALVKELLAKGADINFQNSWGNTALIESIKEKKKDIAKFLLESGADPDKAGNYGTALHVAIYGEQLDFITLLLKFKANPNIHRIETSRYLGKHGTPLHAACLKNNEKVVDILLKHGADVNEVDFYNRTPLHQSSSLAVVKLLLAAGADLHKKDKDKTTPLDNFIHQKQDMELLSYLKSIGENIPESALNEEKKKLVKKKRQKKYTCFELDTYKQSLIESIVKEVIDNKDELTATIYKFKLVFMSFEDMLPYALEICVTNGEDDVYLEYEDPKTNIPTHIDFVEEEDPLLPAFLEKFSLDKDFITWGDTFEIPSSILRYEMISAAQQAVKELTKQGIAFTKDCEICIGDHDEDEGDAESYLKITKDQLNEKLPKRDMQMREAFAKLFYATKEKQEWLCKL